MLIAPGAIAFLLTDRFSRMLLIAVNVAVSNSLLGAYAGFLFDSSPAPTIVLLLTLAFISASLKTSLRSASRQRQQV